MEKYFMLKQYEKWYRVNKSGQEGGKEELEQEDEREQLYKH